MDYGVYIDEKFGRLTVLSLVNTKGRKRLLCKCDCGNTIEVKPFSLKNGNTKSCGCLVKDMLIKRNAKPENSVEFIYDIGVMNFDNGMTCLFDKADYDLIKGVRWYYSGGKNDYVKSSRGSMHRVVITPKEGMVIDHINRDKSDNRRCNLRLVSPKENSHNQPKRQGYSNKYKGVSLKKGTNYYISVCKINGQCKFLGYYKTDIAAAHVWNKYAKSISNLVSENELPFTFEELEEMVKRDLVSLKRAEKISGVKYINWKKGKWIILKRINGVVKRFGTFENIEDAKIKLEELLNNDFNQLN